MKRILFLIALLVMAVWVAYSRRNAAESPPNAGAESHLSDPRAAESESTSRNRARKARPRRPETEDRLAGVNSALARRYLRFMLPGGRLNGDSYDQSIVNNAFKQAWGVNARIDLSEEEQDRMAEFLLEKDWSKWSGMDPKRVEQWAREQLNEAQRASLMDFIEGSRQGELALSQMRLDAKMQEYGAKTPECAFTAEMQQTRRIAELMGSDTDNLSPEKLESRKKELMGAAEKGENDKQADGNAKPCEDEQAYQFFNLLADRIPMTEDQQLAVYGAMRDMLTKEQYEAYLRHYLTEIEMIRFQSRN